MGALLLLFTLLLFFAFKVCASFMTNSAAFLTAAVITIMIAAGFGFYKVRELFVNHDTRFENLFIQGGVRVRPETNSWTGLYSNGAYFLRGSELMFYDGYKLNGRAYGKVFHDQTW